MQTESHRPNGAGGTRDQLSNRRHKHESSREHGNSNYTESTLPVSRLGISIRAICVNFVGAARQLLDDGASGNYPLGQETPTPAIWPPVALKC
jgi:hypothetical protein